MIISAALNGLKPGRVYGLTRASFAIVLVWFGAMNFTSVGETTVASWLDGHALLGQLAVSAYFVAKGIGTFQIISALLILAPKGLSGFHRMGFLMAAVYAALALTLLATNPVWIESLGGFPAIGSGQGIIKYLAVMGLASWAWAQGRSKAGSAVAENIMVAGLILVLVWIGGMKFTLPEAQGIDPLLRSSPFFSWLPDVMSMQAVSNLIGVIELITAGLLAGWWLDQRFFLAGAILAAGTFLLTLSFLVTFPGWSADLGGFPAIGRTGHFLLKDLLLLVCCIVLAAEHHNENCNNNS